MIMSRFLKHFVEFLEGYVFWPNGRLVEWFSLSLMFAWAYKLEFVEGYLSRDIYRGFRHWEQETWGYVFLLCAFVHVLGIVYKGKYWPEVRFLVLVAATSLWTFVTVSFLAAGLQTIATWNFGFLAFTCFALGIRVAWKSSSYH